MPIRIDHKSGMPVTRQVIDQIRAQCAGGALRAGDRLPSVRALAAELAVNPNTVLHAYERLAAEGLIERRHGDGTYVSELSGAAGLAAAQHAALAREADRLVRHAQALRVSPLEFRRLIAQTWENAAHPSGQSPPA
ncbi:MAG: GntR family transcriptional regulator [bacterium]|nr:GntR family transcriptional regulator [bacterium]